MGFFSNLQAFFSASDDHSSHSCMPGEVDISTINPATSLPMLCDIGIDVGGSPFGMDIHTSTFDYD